EAVRKIIDRAAARSRKGRYGDAHDIIRTGSDARGPARLRQQRLAYRFTAHARGSYGNTLHITHQCLFHLHSELTIAPHIHHKLANHFVTLIFEQLMTLYGSPEALFKARQLHSGRIDSDRHTAHSLPSAG